MTHKLGLHSIALDVRGLRPNSYKKGYSAKKRGPSPIPKQSTSRSRHTTNFDAGPCFGGVEELALSSFRWGRPSLPSRHNVHRLYRDGSRSRAYVHVVDHPLHGGIASRVPARDGLGGFLDARNIDVRIEGSFL
jgi:hypothetical protein